MARLPPSLIAPLTALALSTLGCTSDPPAQPQPTACSAEMIDQCLIDQKSCAVGSDGASSCEACAAGSYADSGGSCLPIGGEPMAHTFPENTTEAGGELRGLCRSWTLNNPEPLWINAVELSQNEASHHSNWTFVPDTDFDGPDGTWPCADRNYSQLAAALSGGVLYAQSTQAEHEVQKFPDGVAVRVPANARIISDIHTLNTGSTDITGTATLTIYSIDLSAVKVKLAPFHVTYHGLDIPPQSVSRFTGDCNIEDQFQVHTGQPLDMKVYYLLPHTHALGTRMFVHAIGGPLDGTPLIDVEGFNGEARGRSYDPPLDLAGSTGLRFGCEFTNPREESVGWGFDDQEMCEALGFAEMPIAFESTVNDALDDGTDGNIMKFTGDCGTVSFPWAN